MARGHSARHGRSRCSPKRGPGRRAHVRRSVVRLEAERSRGGGRSMSDTFMPSPPTLAGDRRAS